MNSFDFLGFNRAEIESLLKINLHDSDEDFEYSLKNNLPSWLVPFLSRTSVTLKETAALIVGIKPYISVRGETAEVLSSYESSLWDAVDNGILSSLNTIYHDENFNVRFDCTLVKKEVERWIKEYDFNWALPINFNVGKKEELSDNIRYLDQWGEFAGKETALMFIAGMAMSLQKSNPSCRSGSKMNKSGIARAAAKAITDAGFGDKVVTEKQMTNLINDALKTYMPNHQDD